MGIISSHPRGGGGFACARNCSGCPLLRLVLYEFLPVCHADRCRGHTLGPAAPLSSKGFLIFVCALFSDWYIYFVRMSACCWFVRVFLSPVLLDSNEGCNFSSS